MKKTYLIASAIGAILVFTLPFIAYFISPVNSSAEARSFLIEKGQGVREISQLLKDAGYIKSTPLFIFWSVLSGSADKLKAGNYELSRAMSLPKIVSVLREGPEEDIEVIIREGETLVEIEKNLVDLKIIKKGQLSKFPGKSLEGFLFPDTYRFFPNSDIKDVIRKFLGNFSEKAMPTLSEYKVESIKYKVLSYYDALIVASIIEKEVPFQEDRYLVAGILYRRLKIGMALQVDAYPWTYDNAGLPPKPIANPGLDAIKAAVYPKPSEYLYYLSDPVTKKTIFAKTFEEHVNNKFKYLKR